jgi:hypothetical protein
MVELKTPFQHAADAALANPEMHRPLGLATHLTKLPH